MHAWIERVQRSGVPGFASGVKWIGSAIQMCGSVSERRDTESANLPYGGFQGCSRALLAYLLASRRISNSVYRIPRSAAELRGKPLT